MKQLSEQERSQFLRLRQALTLAKEDAQTFPVLEMARLGMPTKEREHAAFVLIDARDLLTPKARVNYQPSDRSDLNIGSLLLGLHRQTMIQVREVLHANGWSTLHSFGSVRTDDMLLAFKKAGVYCPLGLRLFQARYIELLRKEEESAGRARGDSAYLKTHVIRLNP